LVGIALPDRKVVNCWDLYIDCPILIHGHDFFTDVYKFELTEFDIILGMDWLSKHQAYSDCLKLKATLMGPNGERVLHRGKPLEGGVRLITVVKAQKLLNRGCKGFLCDVLEIKAPESSLKDIYIV